MKAWFPLYVNNNRRILFHPFHDESSREFAFSNRSRSVIFELVFFLWLKISALLPPLPPIIHHSTNNPEMDSRPVQNWSQRGIIHGRRRVQRYFSVAGSSHLRRFLRVTVRVIENNSVTSRMPVIKRNDTDERQPFAARQ